MIFITKPLGPLWARLTSCPIQYYPHRTDLTSSSHWYFIYGNSPRTHLVVDYVKIGRYGYRVMYIVNVEVSALRIYTAGMIHLWMLEYRICHNNCFQRSALSYKLSGTHLHTDTFGKSIGLGNRQHKNRWMTNYSHHGYGNFIMECFCNVVIVRDHEMFNIIIYNHIENKSG